MLGAIVTVGILALMASIAATLSNMLIKRDSGTNSLRIELEELPVRDAYHLAGPVQAATLFYRQALLLWSTFAVLLAGSLFID